MDLHVLISLQLIKINGKKKEMCSLFKGTDENRKTRCNLGKMTFHQQSLLNSTKDIFILL